jgi:hypothetical protein
MATKVITENGDAISRGGLPPEILNAFNYL